VAPLSKVKLMSKPIDTITKTENGAGPASHSRSISSIVKTRKIGIALILVGILLGVILTGAFGFWYVKGHADDMMISEHESRYETVNLTVDAIYDGVDAFNAAHADETDKVGSWTVLDMLNVTEKLKAKDPVKYEDMKDVKIVNLCNGKIAHDLLDDDGRRKLATLMPCAIAVYETDDGVYVSGFDMHMMAMIMPDGISEVLDMVAEADDEILKDVWKAD
jgi:uncharacterized protein (DUF302 family)